MIIFYDSFTFLFLLLVLRALPHLSLTLNKESIQKTKWKFLMAFALKGGRGSRVPLTFFSIFFAKNLND